MDGENNYIMENPIKIDDLGVPLFLETPICFPTKIFAIPKKIQRLAENFVHLRGDVCVFSTFG